MKLTAAALKNFFSQFGLPAYTETTIPDEVELPYISYSLSEPEWNRKASMYAQVWDYGKSNSLILQKADEITAAIGEGKVIDLSGVGYLVIWPETPLIQLMVDGEYRSAYINLSVNAYHKPGV